MAFPDADLQHRDVAKWRCPIKKATDESIRRAFSTVSVKDMFQYMDPPEPWHYSNRQTPRHV